MTCLLQLSRRREWGCGCSWHFASSFGDIILKMGCDDIIWLHVKNKACQWGACSSSEFLFVGSNDAFLGIGVFATAACGDQQRQKCQRLLIPDRHMQTFCWQSMPTSLLVSRICHPDPTEFGHKTCVWPFHSTPDLLQKLTQKALPVNPGASLPDAKGMRHILLSSSVCILIRYR